MQSSATVQVSAAVSEYRLVVVDSSGAVIQIWSNSDIPIEVRGRLGDRNGPLVTLSAATHAEYARISGSIPAGARGLVFSR